MRVLLFSNDLMPFAGLPTSGGGLRCWQLKKGLEAHGIEVISSMPAFTYLTEKYMDVIPQEQKDLLWHWHTQDEILKRTKPDAVLFASNWDHYGLSKKPDVPLIIDLHGSRLIETSMWNEPIDTDRKVEIYSKADCLLCAGQRQRSYFYGWLVQSGRVPEDEHFIRYIPVSLSPEPFEHHYPKEEPLFVSGGGWFPWQNQSTGIFSICERIAKENKGKIEIFGTPHETQTLSAEERKIREIYAKIKGLSDSSDRINVNGYIARDDLLEIYRKASVAVEVMEYNLERELAFTTRTIEYLWCGMPVLYNDFSEISGHIRDYDAGWAVDPTSESQIKSALDEIFSSPEIVKQKGLNAARLVKDRFSWDKTIQPLVDFLNNPVQSKVTTPLKGPIASRSSFLNPGGRSVDVPLNAKQSSLRQHFVIPAENIKTIELPIAVNSKADTFAIEGIDVKLKKASGALIASKSITGNDLANLNRISIDFPIHRLPKGGGKYIFELSYRGNDQGEICLRGLPICCYPLQKSNDAFKAKSLIDDAAKAEALGLSFLPGTGRVYRIKSLIERALWMIRTGQFNRLTRAAIRRIPVVVDKVKAKALG